MGPGAKWSFPSSVNTLLQNCDGNGIEGINQIVYGIEGICKIFVALKREAIIFVALNELDQQLSSMSGLRST